VAAAVTPFPTELTTPPVKKIYLVGISIPFSSLDQPFPESPAQEIASQRTNENGYHQTAEESETGEVV
jgi:hypothetical protein